MHELAVNPLKTTIVSQARFTHNARFLVNRLTIQTIAWSTLVFSGNARASSVEGADNLGFDHHQPLSIVLLLCMRNTRLSLEKLKGVLQFRFHAPRKVNRIRAMSSACPIDASIVWRARQLALPRTDSSATCNFVTTELSLLVVSFLVEAIGLRRKPSPSDPNGISMDRVLLSNPKF